MKPCLVMGSGFHNWVTGKEKSPLCNWDALIDEVASELGIKIPSLSLPSVMRWERILEDASRNGFQHPTDITQWFEPTALSSSKIELRAKDAVTKVLKAQAKEYPCKSGRARFPFDAAFGAVISLNFDHAWVGKSNYTFANKHSKDTGSKKLTAVEVERLRNFMLKHEMPNKSIWFPNGSICAPETIRMGLYDYGTQAHALKVAFSGIKCYERELESRLGTSDWEKKSVVLETELDKAPSEQDPRFSNWVAQFLYRPIYFAGVGLGEFETGLWWLLSQRARNLAKVPLAQRPQTIILRSAKDEKRDFWANRPFGVEAMYCDDWDHGWEMLLAHATPKSVDGGSF